MRIVVVTPTYLVTGDARFADQRLSDYLGNLLASTLALSEATIARLAEPDRVIARHSEVMIPGRDIVLGFEHQSAERRGGANVIRKHPHVVFLIAESLEVRGTIHALSETSFDMKAMLTTLADRFLPVTQARVTIGVGRTHQLELPAVMVNARHLSYVAAVTISDSEASTAP